MGFWNFWSRRRSAAAEALKPDRGFLVFDNTSEVIRAEKTLKDQGWQIKVMGPPPEIRRGCDLVIEFPLLSELEIVRNPGSRGIAPLTGGAGE